MSYNQNYQNTSKKITLNPQTQQNRYYNQSQFKNHLQNKPQTSQQSKYYSPGEIGMFQQFKHQYDQLRKKYQEKVKQTDNLSYQKKKLQVQIMNMNVQFYQRQIKRLKIQVERFQQENQQNKHKFLVAENIKKQLEASLKTKNQEVKTLIKQIQKEKVTNVEMKHQLGQKDKKFNNFVESMQNSNQTISVDYQKASSKASNLESQLRVKTQQALNAINTVEKLNKKLEEQQRNASNAKNIHQQKIKKHETSINQLQTQLRKIKQNSGQQIERMSKQIEQLRKRQRNSQLLIANKVQTANFFKSNRELQQQLHQIQTQLYTCKMQLSQQKKTNKKLLDQIKGIKIDQDKRQLEEEITILKNEKSILQKDYEDKLILLQQQLQKVKIKQFTNPGQKEYIPKNFQELLRNQIQQNNKTKYELQCKIDEIFNMKSQLQQMKLITKSLQNQISILKRKIKSQQKNNKIENDIGLQNMKNDVQSLKRKLQMSQNKLNNKIRQVKEKDNFITSSIIGRSRQQDVPAIMADLTRIFQGDYVNKLMQANQKIQVLRKRIDILQKY